MQSIRFFQRDSNICAVNFTQNAASDATTHPARVTSIADGMHASTPAKAREATLATDWKEISEDDLYKISKRFWVVVFCAWQKIPDGDFSDWPS